MENALQRSLDEIYSRYGFAIAKRYEREQVLVFTLKTGYFNNADIVPLASTSDTKLAFNEFTEAGYACSVRSVVTPQQAEKELFKGFFSVDSILARLKSDYERFTHSIVAPFSADAKYEYINAPYQINGRDGTSTPAAEVAQKLADEKPTLFLIEAAAGFGKTCTAYEIVHLLTRSSEYLPLFSELARNRQAVIFRHILLDEIDRTFPVLSSKLVQTEMKNGRVITILDGFDELLRKTEDGNDFENSEPMLETIGEFLTGRAKVVLTTRRTVLFEGDAFYKWVEKHIEDFDLIRIKISEPQVSHWLSRERTDELTKSGLNIENLANPVLLSYLRCIPDSEFQSAASKPHMLVEKYFDFMLDREQIRQDLRMDSRKQQIVLRTIADDMIQFGYTSEQREYIVDHVLRANSKLLEESLLAYPASERPSKEGLSNKLASHALLDRSVREPNKIGFVNEFVFGHFIANSMLNTEEWLNDDIRFLEPAVLSYQPRSIEARLRLWQKIQSSVEFLPISDRLDFILRLRGEIDFELSNDEALGLEFHGIKLGTHLVSNFQFNECTFRNCELNVANFDSVTFLSCRYFSCSVVGAPARGPIYIFDGTGDQDFLDDITKANESAPEELPPDRAILVEKFILEKWWPRGRDSIIHKHRAIKGICTNIGEFRPHELAEGIASLKKKGILASQASYGHLLVINLEEVAAIREILGRD